MKRLLIITTALFTALSVPAQTLVDDARAWAEELSYSFSNEGRQNWKPEFTARFYGGLVTGGYAITGGVRIDSKRTLGLMVWQGRTWIDAAPAHVHSISAGIYKRRYFHLGKKDIVALYSDLSIGAGYVYNISGGYKTNSETGETVKTIDYSEGDILFSAAWQSGIRFRFWRNIHMFLGPTISTNTFGLHLGVGF